MAAEACRSSRAASVLVVAGVGSLTPQCFCIASHVLANGANKMSDTEGKAAMGSGEWTESRGRERHRWANREVERSFWVKRHRR
jgi:hypothetical protein